MSESRQEMVSHLLQDVLEAAEARSGPLAVGKTPDKGSTPGGKEINYDRFGFRIDPAPEAVKSTVGHLWIWRHLAENAGGSMVLT